MNPDRPTPTQTALLVLVWCLLAACLLFGCTTYREWYPDGTPKTLYESRWKTVEAGAFERDADGTMRLKGYKSDAAAAIDLANKLADKIP